MCQPSRQETQIQALFFLSLSFSVCVLQSDRSSDLLPSEPLHTTTLADHKEGPGGLQAAALLRAAPFGGSVTKGAFLALPGWHLGTVWGLQPVFT